MLLVFIIIYTLTNRKVTKEICEYLKLCKDLPFYGIKKLFVCFGKIKNYYFT